MIVSIKISYQVMVGNRYVKLVRKDIPEERGNGCYYAPWDKERNLENYHIQLETNEKATIFKDLEDAQVLKEELQGSIRVLIDTREEISLEEYPELKEEDQLEKEN